MISIKTPAQIKLMAEGGRILAQIIRELVSAAVPGATTMELDGLARELCKKHKVKPAFLDYRVAGRKYPAIACWSVNDAIVHAIPNAESLKEGDVLGIDMGVIYRGWNSDSAVTVEIKDKIPASPAGRPACAGRSKIKNEKTEQLIDVTREAMMLGIAQAAPGNHIGDIGYAVQTYVEQHDFGVVRDLVGHGIGRELHEEPRIPNFGKPGEGPELKVGMVICIEPMVAAGDWRLVLDKDGWTYRTKDGSFGAHFEHTVAITKNGPLVLT